MRKLIVCILIPFMLSSCVVTTSLTSVKSENTSETEIKATQFFENIMEDLSSFNRGNEGMSLMDLSVRTFSQMLENSPYAYNVNVGGNYDIDFSFNDFNALVKNLTNEDNQSILTLSENCLKLNISLDNYYQLKKMIPFLAQEDIEVYCAEYNKDYSEEDYLTMMEFIAGPQSREGIMSSYVRISFTAPSEIKTTNGIKLSSNQVQFEFSLLDFLLLKEPIQFFCEF